MTIKRRTKIGLILISIGLLMALMLTAFILFSKTENSIYRQMQREVTRMDSEMQHLITSGLNHEELAKTNTGLTIFMSDTLVFWNQNEVNPKLLKRRIAIGQDTICSLLSGNYFVKSYQSGQMTYYVFKRVSTTYQIENQYFENHISGLSPIIEADIDFQAQNGFELKNTQGKSLSVCHIIGNPRLREALVQLCYIPPILLIIVGVLFTLRIQSRTSKKVSGKASHPIEIGISLIILIVESHRRSGRS